jgi:hypothetical protein
VTVGVQPAADLTKYKTYVGPKDGLWRGTATDTLKHGPTGDKVRDAKSVEKPIKKAVVKMFKKFSRP